MANTALNTLFVLTLSYTCVLGSQPFVPLVGLRHATAGALLAAFAVVALVREPDPHPLEADRLTADARYLVAGVVFGWLSYPLWLYAVHMLGQLLGLDAPRIASTTDPPIQQTVASLVFFGPLFEELLWRERVYRTLEPLGKPLAILLASAGFAATHVEPWTVLTTFLLGLFLGALYARTGSILACIGVHAALNASWLGYGIPTQGVVSIPLGDG